MVPCTLTAHSPLLHTPLHTPLHTSAQHSFLIDLHPVVSLLLLFTFLPSQSVYTPSQNHISLSASLTHSHSLSHSPLTFAHLLSHLSLLHLFALSLSLLLSLLCSCSHFLSLLLLPSLSLSSWCGPLFVSFFPVAPSTLPPPFLLPPSEE